MASALLASRNETCWGDGDAWMRRCRNSNPNPNSRKAGFDSSVRVHVRRGDESAIADAPVSDDSSALNRKSISLGRKECSAASTVPGGRYVTYDITAYSRRERRDLKERLARELDQIRSFTRRIECEFPKSGNTGPDNGAREVTSLSAMNNCPSGAEIESNKNISPPLRKPGFPNGKRKMPPAAKLSGTKRPLPAPPAAVSRDPKRVARETVVKSVAGLMKRCMHILEKLMDHKPHWVFNRPVDVVALGLRDYHQIVSCPMDLGTVRLKLKKNLYQSPLDFAHDVRLTFNNAMRYNPKGHEIHSMAERLLYRFEEMFASFNLNPQPPDSTRSSTSPEPVKRPEPPPTPIRIPSPVRNQPPPVQYAADIKLAAGKQPKPKAKDPNKREMNFEEKQKLSMSLQSLPQEKMDQVLQIIKRRNSNLSQNGDEIEVDIESVDTETLWELDRFVVNFKKLQSKMRRQALAQTQLAGTEVPAAVVDKSVADEMAEAAASSKNSKRMDQPEEYVDIGEYTPSTNFPPVEIEKDVAAGGCASGASSSSSSTSDSSSSSNSDSDTSSGSGSDSDEVMSPFTGAKADPPRT